MSGQDAGFEVLERAWPEGVPSEEVAFYRTLPERSAKLLLRRLQAILAAEERDTVPVESLAEGAGISRSLLFDLKKKWSMNKSLSTITPFHRVAARISTEKGAGQRISRIAAELVSRTPDHVAAGQVAREIAKIVGNPNSFPAALRHVRLSRLRMSTDIEYLALNFGHMLLIDLIGARLQFVGRSRLTLPDIALVMERSSRLILGFALIRPKRALEGQCEAIRNAIEFLAENRVDRPLRHSAHPEVEFVTGESPRAIEAGLQLAEAPGVKIFSTGARRFGQRITSLLGARLGKIVFASRSTGQPKADPAADGRGSTSFGDLSTLVAIELARHNGPIITKLMEAQETNKLALVCSGAMASRLDLVMRAVIV